ncbi:DUF1716-domain-containing protein [Dacryopinax primogenitus]|uniref:DUF1716-domain-containing protein n=1 Tax=Dacryopinax primogenitus (strain DJM 731) TaxID=1858805 RepID=M5G6Y9_DACPD|nr:DUF1716-domain-containing protein [Dacryopinax primogenitus]EJU06016.1 DUF1716-domain-containing protein [Dacryopinax primogenitus]
MRLSSSDRTESLADSTPVSQLSKGKGKARVEIEEEEDGEDVGDGEFAPGGDADYFAEEDEEGRFYGGGLTGEQKQILDIFDHAQGEGAIDNITVPAVRRLSQRFERAVNKNQDQRSKYPDDPTKFIDSEADLDAAIRSLLPLAQVPSIAYPEIVKLGTIERLVGLLAHENADIVITVVEVLHELTDEDVGDEADEDEENEQKKTETMKVLVDSLVSNAALELLVQNLPRFNEEEESDRQGIFHTLGIFENMIGFNPQLSRVLVSKTSIMKWLLERIQKKGYDENKGYAAELLAITLQENRDNRLEYGKLDGVDVSLRVLSQYRKKDPDEGDETEFMENVFDALCSALAEPEIKKLFVDAEGVELMVIMMKEKKVAHSRSIKVLDHALSGVTGTAGCETFVEALGLKTLFSAFMGKGEKKKKAAANAAEDTAHTLGIISSLFTNLPSDSPARIRLLAKWVEADYEKVTRLVEIREHARARLEGAEQGIEQEKKDLATEGEEMGDDDEVVWYLRRLESGLDVLQLVDYIGAWISMEDDGARARFQELLNKKGKSFADVVKVLIEFHDNIGEESEDEQQTDSPSQRTIIEQLIPFLEASEQ